MNISYCWTTYHLHLHPQSAVKAFLLVVSISWLPTEDLTYGISGYGWWAQSYCIKNLISFIDSIQRPCCPDDVISCVPILSISSIHLLSSTSLIFSHWHITCGLFSLTTNSLHDLFFAKFWLLKANKARFNYGWFFGQLHKTGTVCSSPLQKQYLNYSPSQPPRFETTPYGLSSVVGTVALYSRRKTQYGDYQHAGVVRLRDVYRPNTAGLVFLKHTAWAHFLIQSTYSSSLYWKDFPQKQFTRNLDWLEAKMEECFKTLVHKLCKVLIVKS